MDAVADSIVRERTVDLVTVGRRSGTTRVTEIWTTVVGGELYVCGTPAGSPDTMEPEPRDWLANLLAEPAFTLRLKQSVAVDLSAHATPVLDRATRQRVFESPQSAYYRANSRSMEDLLDHGPMVRVDLTGEAAAVTAALRAAGRDSPS